MDRPRQLPGRLLTRFGRALTNSLIFTVVAIAMKLVLGMAMALALNPGVLRRNFLRAYLLIPWVLPGFVAYMIWRWFWTRCRASRTMR